jgi:hypothetical protein
MVSATALAPNLRQRCLGMIATDYNGERAGARDEIATARTGDLVNRHTQLITGCLKGLTDSWGWHSCRYSPAAPGLGLSMTDNCVPLIPQRHVGSERSGRDHRGGRLSGAAKDWS